MINYEQLIELMADITLKRRSDPKAVTNLLKKIHEAHVDIKILEQAKTERLLRELLSLPMDMFKSNNKQEFERMKLTARQVLKKWAD